MGMCVMLSSLVFESGEEIQSRFLCSRNTHDWHTGLIEVGNKALDRVTLVVVVVCA